VLTALVPRKRQPWPKCPQSHFPLDLCERESTADEFDAMWKVMDGEKLQPLLVTGIEHLKDLSGMGDPTGLTTAGIAPRVVRVLKPLQQVKLRIPMLRIAKNAIN
ncbi:hypothetical protein TNCV_1544351, partial [Trichonephila clavipes]